jgi:hypothetical protein
MELSGLHLLLTYQCTLECEHCFVWGSPWQSGTLTLENLRQILEQAGELGSVRSFYFEGGEPFLYYALLVEGVRMATGLGFSTGIVSNGYWATSVEDARTWLKPFAGLIQDLSISSDLYHWDEKLSRHAEHARCAAEELDIPVGVISIAQPEARDARPAAGMLPANESKVMFRGRASQVLVGRVSQQPWMQFTQCPYEDLRDPGRVHLDPFGNVHICQGISLGNLFSETLAAICAAYDPDTHPILGPLLTGGPVELARRYNLPHGEGYADACHLCYEMRTELRERFPEILAPDAMYGGNGD